MKYAFDYMEIEIVKYRLVKVYMNGRKTGKKYTTSLGGTDRSVKKYVETLEANYLPWLLLHGNILTTKLRFIAKEQGVLKFSVTSLLFNIIPIGFDSPYFVTESLALDFLKKLE